MSFCLSGSLSDRKSAGVVIGEDTKFYAHCEKYYKGTLKEEAGGDDYYSYSLSNMDQQENCTFNNCLRKCFFKGVRIRKRPYNKATLKEIVDLFRVFSSRLSEYRLWNPVKAVHDAERDIKTGEIKVCIGGTWTQEPVGIPKEYHDKFTGLDVQNTWFGDYIDDPIMYTLQMKYSERYNKRILRYMLAN